MKKWLMILVGIAFVAGVIGGAYAQFAKPEHAIKYRKAVMFLIAQHFGRMGAMVKEKIPYNQEIFARNAKPAKFKEVVQNFETQTSKLVSVAQSGDFTGIKAQFGEVGKSCKACHSQFRTK
jgi:cytochrome c556